MFCIPTFLTKLFRTSLYVIYVRLAAFPSRSDWGLVGQICAHFIFKTSFMKGLERYWLPSTSFLERDSEVRRLDDKARKKFNIYILLSSRRADGIAVISSCHSHASANSNLLATRQLLTRQMLATDLRTALTFCRRALGRFSTRLPWGVYTTNIPFSPTSFTFFSTK